MRPLSLALWFALIATLAVSTFFTETPVYGCWWFSALWILVALFIIIVLLSRRITSTPVRLLHLGLLVIIVGALVTRATSSRGILFLEPGHPADRYLEADGRGRDLGARVSLDSIKPLYPNDIKEISGYICYLTVDNRLQIVSPNNPLTLGHIQLCQASVSTSGATVFSVNSDFWGRNLVYLGYLLTVTGFFCQICRKRSYLPQLIGFLVIVIIFTLTSPHPPFNPLGIFGQSPESQPLLQSHFLLVHVSLLIASYTLLVLISILSVYTLFRPSPRVTALTTRLLSIAIFLLTTGIVAGSLWGARAWGRYWAWDPKETWALVTLMVYAVPIHPSLTAVYDSRRLSLYLIFAFFTVLMTYYGVNYLPSLHAYR